MVAGRKLRGGMVGGGYGSFIGAVHRMALCMDGQAELVSGVFSSDSEKSRAFAEGLYLDPARVYGDYAEMARAEAALPPEQRIDFVSIVTPNDSHFPIAKAFLEAGFHVVCDKPMTCSLAEAKELRHIVRQSGKVFSLTHTYLGYTMVKQARHVVREGSLGKITKVLVEYPQGWLASLLEGDDEPLHVWRMDPARAGPSCCIGDIGTHAEILARYVTGLEIDELCADLSSYIPGNRLDDDGNILVRYHGGARGVIHASQISTGEENDLNIRVYGTRGSLSWHQEQPNTLTLRDMDGTATTYSRGSRCLCEAAKRAIRVPTGHPEGFVDAFANIYLETFRAIRAQQDDGPNPTGDFPTVDDGVLGMAFIETVVASAFSDRKWTKLLV